MQLIYRTYSARETALLAFQLAKEVIKIDGPFVIALQGNIGTGKTTFIKGFARGLGIRERLTSPTFVLMKYIPIPRKRKTLIHIDAYRLKNAAEFLRTANKDVFLNKNHIIVVEWAKRINTLIKKNALYVSFKHTKNKNKRIIMLEKK